VSDQHEQPELPDPTDDVPEAEREAGPEHAFLIDGDGEVIPDGDDR
jgi:hypothetical protein